MSGMWGSKIIISIFGESHGNAIGINIDGLPSGLELDIEDIAYEMRRRAPGKSPLSTARSEDDIPEILSGYFNGKTTGTPLCAIIRNTNTRSKDYSLLKDVMRPGHADYSGNIRYNGFNDYRGGGHFSGRITAPLVFVGAICKQILKEKGITVAAHVKSIKNIKDKSFLDSDIDLSYLEALKTFELPLLDKNITLYKPDSNFFAFIVSYLLYSSSIKLTLPPILSTACFILLNKLLFFITSSRAISFVAFLFTICRFTFPSSELLIVAIYSSLYGLLLLKLVIRETIYAEVNRKENQRKQPDFG